MRVKALFLVSLFLTTWVASTVARAQFQHHFLAGGEIGVESRTSEFVNRYQLLTQPLVGPVTAPWVQNHASTRVSDTGSFMGLLAGWQFQCNRWLGGIEANVDFHSFEEHEAFIASDQLSTALAAFNPYQAIVKYERGTRIGAYLRGGYWVTPFFLGYLKAGVQFSRDQLTYAIPARQVTPFSEPIINEKDDIWGVVGGVGLEFPAFASTSVRVEYNYVRTEKFLVNDSVGRMQGTLRMKSPDSHIGKVAWVWNFT